MTRPDADLSLIRRVAEGDADALEALYDRHTAMLYQLALRIVRVAADAEEVLQQAWLKVWDRAGDHEPSRGSVIGWLLAIVRGRALDRQRSRTARRKAEGALELSATPSAPDPLTGAEQLQIHQRVRLALQRLDPHYRQVLESAYFEGLTQTQIAERLEAPLGTVKTWTRRGLVRLRELLPEELGA